MKNEKLPKKRERKNNTMQCVIYRLRKKGIRIDMRNRTIFFNFENPDSIDFRGVERLCSEFGFGLQYEF
ncbi:hypothetical protein D0T56_14890 [Dysgonomonas sp. 520]|nr:hypothetical protein [Dysgonomonas sp. 520]